VTTPSQQGLFVASDIHIGRHRVKTAAAAAGGRGGGGGREGGRGRRISKENLIG